MSHDIEDKEIRVTVDGKAVYKAVKNVLIHDQQFKQEVAELANKQMSDKEYVKSLVISQIENAFEDSGFQKKVEQMINTEVNKILPDIMSRKLDRIMKQSILDVFKKLTEK